jgi:hypothetical protein
MPSTPFVEMTDPASKNGIFIYEAGALYASAS